jgi:ABC-type dipeptide/oligopeptide/nickel transport system permease component
MIVLRYIGSRLLFLIPQLIGIVLVGFVLIKAVPGDPATLMLGPMASADSIAKLRGDLGLDQPMPMQFLIYLEKLIRGDFGTSWQTTQPVLSDLRTRFPATLELVTYGLLLALLIAIPLGVFTAATKRGAIRKLGGSYGLIAGALPDFWLALVLVFIFYSQLRWLSSPIGRIDLLYHRQFADRQLGSPSFIRPAFDFTRYHPRPDQCRSDSEDDTIDHGTDAWV